MIDSSDSTSGRPSPVKRGYRNVGIRQIWHDEERFIQSWTDMALGELSLRVSRRAWLWQSSLALAPLSPPLSTIHPA